MSNSIEYVSQFLPLLDEKYAYESRTSNLETSGDLIQATANAKTVLIAKIALQGLADYDRAGGFVDGDIDLDWESHTFSHDRGRSFNIDVMDNDETLGTLFTYTVGEFLRLKVVPEIDAVRFATYASKAGTKVIGNLSSLNIVTAIDDAFVAMEDEEVNIDNCILYITPAKYQNVKDSDKFERPLAPSESPNRNYGSYDGHPVVKVPKNRFYTAITLYDGKTSEGGVDQTEGGYVKAESGRSINFIIIDPTAVIQITKHAILRAFSPEENQKADAWKIDYRIYHDAWVLENRAKGIYVHVADESNIEIDPSTLTIAKGGDDDIALSGVDSVDSVTATSDNDDASVEIVSAEKATVTISDSASAGTANIVFTDANGNKATCVVTITAS